jgi:hypothetical protein
MESAKPMNDMTAFFGEVIHTYTRAQAIEDGYLVDVSETAREAGFVLPVAMTRNVWEDCVEWCDEDSNRQTHQDLSGRLWDVLWMAYIGIKHAKHGGTQLMFQLYRVPRGGRKTKPRLVTLKLVTGPADDTEPVVTIMQPEED